MPAKPCWYRKLPYIIEELRRLPRPDIDRATLEFLLGISPRRAQQIMAPCVTGRIGSSGLADRDALVERLQAIAAGDEASWEVQRRRNVATALAALQQDRLNKPRVLVEAPAAVVNQEFETLPAGVKLEPGRITVEFDRPRQGLEKLLALAMAIGNDFERFEARVTLHPSESERRASAADGVPCPAGNRCG